MATARTKYQPVAVTWIAPGSSSTSPASAIGCSCSSSRAKYSRMSIRWASSIDSNSTRPWHISAMITARRSRSSRVSARPRTHRQLALAQRVVVLVQRLGVLAVGGARPADGRHAQADQVAVGLRAVALEVAVQPALALGHGQRVVGQREVVHADVVVAAAQEAGDGVAAACATRCAGAGQLGGDDAPLRLEALRQVGIGVQRNAVGPQLADLLHGAGEATRASACGRP